MNVTTKKKIINKVREKVGWAYNDFKFLPDDEAKPANLEREKLINYLVDNNAKFAFSNNKIYCGELSPGCITCGQGTWSCMFINELCTARCFFCAQDRTQTKEGPSFPFDTPDDYVEFLERVEVYKGVGITGGEPLMVFDKVLHFIEKIRKKFGQDMYIWMYTNGDLVDVGKLKLLKKYGLDELRFNTVYRKYRMNEVELATKYIKRVSIEIPAIPEDFEIQKRSLRKMREIGVKYLNLHQLFPTESNYKNFLERNYVYTHSPNLAVVNSEMTALKLMKYNLDKKIGLSINYCAHAYKNRLQSRGERIQYGNLLRKNYEGVTRAGYLRQISIKNSPSNIKKVIQELKKHRSPENLAGLNKTQNELIIHHSVLKYIDFDKHTFRLRYFDVTGGTEREIQEYAQIADTFESIVLSSGNKFFVKKIRVCKPIDLGATAMESFIRIYIKNKSIDDTYKYFVNNYESDKKITVNNFKKELAKLDSLYNFEEVEFGLPEIF